MGQDTLFAPTWRPNGVGIPRKITPRQTTVTSSRRRAAVRAAGPGLVAGEVVGTTETTLYPRLAGPASRPTAHPERTDGAVTLSVPARHPRGGWADSTDGWACRARGTRGTVTECHRRVVICCAYDPDMGLVVAIVAGVALLAAWITWTATRVDRLHVRLDAARAALDCQLVRRAAALQALVDRSAGRFGEHTAAVLRAVARASLEADEPTREVVENDLSRALHDLPPDLDPALMADLADAGRRVAYARRFHNDAVRDTLALRRLPLPRLLRLGGRQPLPVFFEIDNTLPVPATRPV